MNNDWRILEPYDWRYSAAITGLIRYFKYFDEKKDDWKIENECLIYNTEIRVLSTAMIKL